MLAEFKVIVVGIDGSDAGLAALDQARGLLAPDGSLVAVTVCEERLAVHAGFDAPRVGEELHRAAEDASRAAAALLADLPRGETRLEHGRPTCCLLAVAEELGAELIAVGSHEHSRAAAIALGSVASEILHKASQSVLVARSRRGGPFTGVVVGVDGSRQSLLALALGRALAHAPGVWLRAVAATGGKPLEPDGLARIHELERDIADPVTALVAAGEEADLLVLGSRGLHGLASLGSVSERVAHRASCSVLVVRDPPGDPSV